MKTKKVNGYTINGCILFPIEITLCANSKRQAESRFKQICKANYKLNGWGTKEVEYIQIKKCQKVY